MNATNAGEVPVALMPWDLYNLGMKNIERTMQFFSAPIVFPPEKKADIKYLLITPEKTAAVRSLMEGVRPTEILGDYKGRRLTLARSRFCAKKFGEDNDVHINPDNPSPFFGGRLIAHGMDGLTQGFAAQEHRLQGSGLVPEHLEIKFCDPGFHYKIVRPRILWQEGSQATTMELTTGGKKNPVLITQASISLRQRTKSEVPVEEYLHGLWLVSAMIADNWKNAIFGSLEVTLHPEPLLSQSDLRGIVVKGIGKKGGDGKKTRIILEFSVCVAARRAEPFISGVATIFI